MAIAKTRTSLWSGQSLSAGGSNVNSSWIDLSAVDEAQVNFRLTNGATGPTVAAQVQIQVANDYNAGSPTLPVNYGGAFIGVTPNSGVSSWSVPLMGEGIAAVRLVAGGNTGQAVTVDADISAYTKS